ncbi:phage tail tube protein [Alkalihalophilus marmarensis]|uniref:phage tail tube protein n=1 Tax=Alkalihalophilus marmarensis TaxID=521377 RepID=UPI002E229BEE|nr:phage tail protein [Alkalihalophilus marmarensis]
MARQKNALTKYEVAPMPTESSEPSYKRLAKWVTSVTDASDENVETTGYYDGDGTPEQDVTYFMFAKSFEGTYDDEDEAMNFIKSLKFNVGEGRKIMWRVTHPDGEVLEGPATVTGPITSGGDATGYPVFNCTIAFNRKPEITPAP